MKTTERALADLIEDEINREFKDRDVYDMTPETQRLAMERVIVKFLVRRMLPYAVVRRPPTQEERISRCMKIDVNPKEIKVRVVQ